MFKGLTAALAFAIITITTNAAPVQWTTGPGANFHWYEFVILSAGVLPEDAESMAESMSFMGEAGYLATITSAEEQSFLNSIWPGPGSVAGQFMDDSFFLIGASDRDVEGTFRWIGGPEDGSLVIFTNWSGGEPNNSGDEDYVVAWWLDQVEGEWNDIPASSDVLAFVVEYNGTPIPLPAGLPLLATALGLLTIFRGRTTV